ncbi:hypothetical protein [Roseateles saccharophilus]|uniref:Uncharacterized protein n=1 Tax=Roseateles saccharophilus TaxID=304 RepID=A0A4R3ULA1_ROSSA|nr:hypothetical protein [Roseateles saccharophilus]MDG0834188.1 hypothetical protein [Roseateles saccharophilus]TCU91291.1 hypothetical protein EV671_10266 [Roseateles saccharophilus]
MSWLSDNLSFEQLNLQKIAKQLMHDPARALVGAVDPASTKVWNGVLGTHWDPLVDQMGGPTSSAFSQARAAGINTGPASTMHDIAHVIAAFEAGGYGMGQLGAAGGAAGDVGAGSVGGAADYVPTSVDAAAQFGSAGYGPAMDAPSASDGLGALGDYSHEGLNYGPGGLDASTSSPVNSSSNWLTPDRRQALGKALQNFKYQAPPMAPMHNLINQVQGSLPWQSVVPAPGQSIV